MNLAKMLKDLTRLEKTWVLYVKSPDNLSPGETKLILRGVREAINLVKKHVSGPHAIRGFSGIEYRDSRKSDGSK